MDETANDDHHAQMDENDNVDDYVRTGETDNDDNYVAGDETGTDGDTNHCQSDENVKIIFSPDGKSKAFIPICEPDSKPYIKQRFESLDDGINFYSRYGAICGFDVRKGTQRRARDNSIVLKYVYCHREGEKHSLVINTPSDDAPTNKRRKRIVSKRSGCEAFILFRARSDSTFIVKDFEEQHNHPLCSERYRHFLKINRKMTPAHQRFVLDCARVNIGPTKSFRMYKETVGGYSNVGCTSVDFKNFSRDLKAYGNGCDAQMLLDNLFKKRELSSAFYFAYDTDNKDNLTRLFWSDPTSRRNYAAFGDVVSFDATYSTNRYNMIFAPFTGLDNHRRIVTFGSGLLSKEDTDSYSWLLSKFKECMSRAPQMIITDQDQGMKNAIARVIPETRHRYCMWHINKKIGERVPFQLKTDQSFKKKIDAVIWSELIEPEAFEKGWNEVMTEFNLTNHTWLSLIFESRDRWIPAYFRDEPLSGLMRTTSVSESVNSFFSRYLNKSSNLVEFFMQYGSALDAQRHAQDQLNCQMAMSIPELKTPLAIERHAMSLYTTKIFYETQVEIAAACYSCRVLNIHREDPCCAYKLDNGINTQTFDVLYNSTEDTYTCSCKKFVRVGLLCRHIFFLFKDQNVEVIPDKYILSRWTKNVFQKISFADGMDISDVDDPTIEQKMVLNQLYSEFYRSVGLIESDTETMKSLISALREFNLNISSVDNSVTAQTTKQQLIKNFHAYEVPNVVTIHPPVPVYNKGSGKRIKSAAEIAMEISKKPLRLCKKCKKKTNHDSRNCDKFSRDAASQVS